VLGERNRRWQHERLPANSLEAKARLAPSRGFAVAPEDVNPALKDFCRAIVPWLLRGRLPCAVRQLRPAQDLHADRDHAPGRRRFGGEQLIVLPLNVRIEFLREVEARFSADPYSIAVRFIPLDR